jgi:excisionase family DNA binding protein
MEKLLKVSEVARKLNVSRHTVLNWIKRGKIKAIRLPGGRYRIPESEVRKIIEGSS